MTTAVAVCVACTVREIGAIPLRVSASVIVQGRFLAPAEVLLATVAWKENVLSPGVTSPFELSSKRDCVTEPPIVLRSQVTAKPVLAGFVPGVVATVNRVE